MTKTKETTASHGCANIIGEKSMFFSRKDIEGIQDVLAKFPEVNTFEIEVDSSSGIGSITIMKFDAELNGLKGEFSVQIGDVEDW